MRFDGRLKSWNADRGFGFIEPFGGGQDIFLHFSAVPNQLRPPTIGQEFSFEVELNRDGKKRASNVGVRFVAQHRRRARNQSHPRRSAADATAIPIFIAIYITVALTQGVSAWVATAYVFLSLICLSAYASDKSAAIAGRWRSSEQSLLLLGLIGGWPGGLIAQHLFRHKSNKREFRNAFWGTVTINISAFVVYFCFFRSAFAF